MEKIYQKEYHLKKGNKYFREMKYFRAYYEYEQFHSKHDEISWLVNSNRKMIQEKVSKKNGLSLSESNPFFDFLYKNQFLLNVEKSNRVIKISCDNETDILINLSEIIFYGENFVCNKEKNIVFICDEEFVDATVVALSSCLRNSSGCISFNILAVDCIDLVLSKIGTLNLGDSALRIISCSNVFQDVESYKGLVTSTALFKFVLPSVFDDFDKILYLDSDVVALNRFSEIFDLNLDGYYAAVVEDYVGEYIHKENERISKEKYFNSGVMYLNLEKLRCENMPRKMIDFKIKRKDIKYMDQDVFNILCGDAVCYIDGYYNFMTTNNRLSKNVFDKIFPDFKNSNIVFNHFTYKKPWNESSVDRASLWYQEFSYLFGFKHRLDATCAMSKTDELAANFKNSLVRKKSVLLIEAADCHGEIMPGLAFWFLSKGYNVDVLFTNNNYELNALSQKYFYSIRIFNNDKYNLYKFFNLEKFNEYEVIFFTSRTLYYAKNGKQHPSIYEYFDGLLSLKKKIISLEHHLEYVDVSNPPNDNFVVLANPQGLKFFENKVVNFPLFPLNKSIETSEKIKFNKFLIVGNIENERKNFSLLLETFEKMVDLKMDFELKIVARRGSIQLPDKLEDYVSVFFNVDYDELYSIVEDSDFLLPMLDPKIKEHHRYLTVGTSGTFQLSMGFGKPCIINTVFADKYGFDSENSILYNDEFDFKNSIINAINMNSEDYLEMQKNLGLMKAHVIEVSEKNLTNLIESIGV